MKSGLSPASQAHQYCAADFFEVYSLYLQKRNASFKLLSSLVLFPTKDIKLKPNLRNCSSSLFTKITKWFPYQGGASLRVPFSKENWRSLISLTKSWEDRTELREARHSPTSLLQDSILLGNATVLFPPSIFCPFTIFGTSLSLLFCVYLRHYILFFTEHSVLQTSRFLF